MCKSSVRRGNVELKVWHVHKALLKISESTKGDIGSEGICLN